MTRGGLERQCWRRWRCPPDRFATRPHPLPFADLTASLYLGEPVGTGKGRRPYRLLDRSPGSIAGGPTPQPGAPLTTRRLGRCPPGIGSGHSVAVRPRAVSRCHGAPTTPRSWTPAIRTRRATPGSRADWCRLTPPAPAIVGARWERPRPRPGGRVCRVGAEPRGLPARRPSELAQASAGSDQPTALLVVLPELTLLPARITRLRWPRRADNSSNCLEYSFRFGTVSPARQHRLFRSSCGR